MNIFIWNNPYSVPYGGSFLFVAAQTEEDARKLAKSVPIVAYGFGRPEKTFGSIELGEPTRVIEAPGGECYQWSE